MAFGLFAFALAVSTTTDTAGSVLAGEPTGEPEQTPATRTPQIPRTPTPSPSPTEEATNTPVATATEDDPTPPPPADTPTPDGGAGAGVQPPDTGTGDSAGGDTMIWLAVAGLAAMATGGGLVFAGARRRS